jgi:predicted nucleic acid-binding protein
VVEEHESEALRDHLAASEPQLVTSAVAEVELIRAVRLVDDRPETREQLVALLEEVTLHRVTDRVLRRARDVDPPLLRTLDAIHLASALDAGAQELLVYDHRLADAARMHGLAVLSPGV